MPPLQTFRPTHAFDWNQSQAIGQRVVAVSGLLSQEVGTDRKQLDETLPQFSLWKYWLKQAANDCSDKYGQHNAKVRIKYRLDHDWLFGI